jgi:serine/threonine protein phosphatase PrpC
MKIEAAGITHQGAVRENNEDCIAIGFWVEQQPMQSARVFEHVLDQPFACLIADGMGGHNDGEKASQLVAHHLARRLCVQGPQNIGPSVRAVNAELFAQVRENPELAGMGSTVVGLAADHKRLALFNVGDSRGYRVTDGRLVQLSVDDSTDPQWKSGGGKERTGKLLQCFGGRTTFTDIEPNVHREPLAAGGVFLLCCDGLYETLTEEEIAALIGADLKASAEALLHAALERKARDNVSIALVRITE